MFYTIHKKLAFVNKFFQQLVFNVDPFLTTKTRLTFCSEFNLILINFFRWSIFIQYTGAHLGFSEGRGPNFSKGVHQYKTKNQLF